ncbi:YveK family protein [Sporosarcina ureae]|uniref:YveK family protein n=1 Tax=Sporosarcina ureae TaxID=1571 RepID=UPI0026EF8C4E|nr:Wzz/FepE/Etk N-terminal domain-containing protein [Sporosarcina ureae]
MNENINLQELFAIIKKKKWLIIGVVSIAILFTAMVNHFLLTPIYQASTQILVTQQQAESELDSLAIQTDLQLINTYNVIIKSPVILSDVVESLDLGIKPSDLYSQLIVSSEQNSQVMNLTVQDLEPHKAVDIANTTAQVFQRKIVDLMQVDNVHILSPAMHSENPSPIRPNKQLNMAIAIIIGLLVGVGISFLLEYLDTTVKTEYDIEELLNLPILGLVSTISDKEVAVVDTAKKGFDAHVKEV